MSQGNTHTNSDIWIPALKTLCLDLLKNLQNRQGGHYLRFRDDLGEINKPGKIVKEYHRTVKLLKYRIFGKNAPNSYIDHHKIAALYIRSFLKYKPFCIEKPKEAKLFKPNLYTILANEYFTLPFLEAIFRAWNDDFNGCLEMDPIYKDDFIKILFSYKENIATLNPLSLSNKIYLIEQNYFKHSK